MANSVCIETAALPSSAKVATHGNESEFWSEKQPGRSGRGRDSGIVNIGKCVSCIPSLPRGWQEGGKGWKVAAYEQTKAKRKG